MLFAKVINSFPQNAQIYADNSLPRIYAKKLLPQIAQINADQFLEAQ
jgi:hypothetical protein